MSQMKTDEFAYTLSAMANAAGIHAANADEQNATLLNAIKDILATGAKTAMQYHRDAWERRDWVTQATEVEIKPGDKVKMFGVDMVCVAAGAGTVFRPDKE